MHNIALAILLLGDIRETRSADNVDEFEQLVGERYSYRIGRILKYNNRKHEVDREWKRRQQPARDNVLDTYENSSS